MSSGGLKINPDSVRLMIGNVEVKLMPGMENFAIGKPLPSAIALEIEIGDADLRKFIDGRVAKIRAVPPRVVSSDPPCRRLGCEKFRPKES